MRFVHAAFLLALFASPALAQTGPVIVIPGRPDVPVMENGVDISWSVVEGEFGLDRPGQVTPTVIYRVPPPVVAGYPDVDAAAEEPGYFPRDGRKPGYGRLEIAPPPNRRLPPPAQSYRRSWSSESAPTPADLPSNNPTYVSPIIAPTFTGPPGPPGPPGPWSGGNGHGPAVGPGSPGMGPGIGPGNGAGIGPGNRAGIGHR
jgi:hypothetical protein